ncbi:hypothetical protein [Larkinella arboricola]
MDVHMISPIYNLDTTPLGDLSHVPFVKGQSLLSSGTKAIEQVFPFTHIYDLFGRVGMSYLLNNMPCFVFTNDFESESRLNEYLSIYPDKLIGWKLALWLVKDNSVSIPETLVMFEDGEGAILNKEMQFSNARGLFESCTINKEEFGESMVYNELLLQTVAPKTPPKIEETTGIAAIKPATLDFKLLNRVGRATSFIQMGRKESYLPAKISFYVLTLEALFAAGERNEIAHKVGERAAFYVGGNGTEKLANFQLIKAMYNIRSAFFHGSPIPGTNLTEEKSVQLDNLLRQILRKILKEDSEIFTLKDDTKLAEWFNNLLFQRSDKAQEGSVPEV